MSCSPTTRCACMYDRKHIRKMMYPAENKNAEYLKLLVESKGITPTSIGEKDPTKVAKEATTIVKKEYPSGVTGKNLSTVGNKATIYTKKENSSGAKEATASIRKGNSKPRSTKRKLSQERVKEEEPILEKEVEFGSIKKEETSKEKVLNPVQTFVCLFGGRKGRCWAKQDEAAIIPSERKTQDMEMVSVKQDLAEAKELKYSAHLAMRAAKREIKAAFLKQKWKAAPFSKEVTDTMSKEQKKATKKKTRKQKRQEVRLALNEKIRNVVRVFKKAQEQCRESKKREKEAKKMKKEVDVRARRAHYHVRRESEYAMSQKGFNLNNRLLEGTRHQDNQWTAPQANSREQDFPRSNVTYDFTHRLFCNFLDRPFSKATEIQHTYSSSFTDGPNDSRFPSSADRPYSNNPTFMELQHTNSSHFTNGPNDPSFPPSTDRPYINNPTFTELQHTNSFPFTDGPNNPSFPPSGDRPYINNPTFTGLRHTCSSPFTNGPNDPSFPPSADRPYSNNPTFTELQHTNSSPFTDGPNNPSFPPSADRPYSNNPTFTELRHRYSSPFTDGPNDPSVPSFADRPYSNNPTFTELQHTYSSPFTYGPNEPSFHYFADRPYIYNSYLYGATTHLQFSHH